MAGIPFLAGRIDIKKLYFYKNSDGNLEIKIFEHRSGAALLVIFLSEETRRKTIIFENLNDDKLY